MDLAALFAAVEDAPPVAAADVVGDHLKELLGASAVSLLVADLSGKALVRLTHDGHRGDATRRQEDESAERVPLRDSPQGRALKSQEVEVEADADGAAVFAPVTNRGEAIGVLELRLGSVPEEDTLADLVRVAHALAYVVVSNRRFTDLFEWGQRSAPLSLAAEIQRRLLPGSYTCEAGPVTVAGWLQPVEEIAGDTFDFSLERGTLHLSITDAMGHEVDAALAATTVVGALRNARRGGDDLTEQARRASSALSECIGGGVFATAHLVRVDLGTGTAAIVNAGHPLPLRLRSGEVSEVRLETDPPLGAVPGHRYRVQKLPLEPEDRVFFLTDGVLERNAAALDVGSILAATAGDHPRDAVQELMHALLEATGGDLQDDATVLCVEWHGDGARKRATSAGADR